MEAKGLVPCKWRVEQWLLEAGKSWQGWERSVHRQHNREMSVSVLQHSRGTVVHNSSTFYEELEEKNLKVPNTKK